MLSEQERITKLELELLRAFDMGKKREQIARETGLTEEKVSELLEKAEEKRNKIMEEAKTDATAFVYYRPLDSSLNITQKGTMKVGSQVLKLLSEGIYSSPANSLKELINNAFDADASIVKINFTDDEIIIWDNGNGMDYKDFDEEFAFISRSRKREKGLYTEKYHRPKIGFIGIGFIAVSELCDYAIVRSAKEKSELMFEARIDFSKYRGTEAGEKEFYEVSEFDFVNFRKTEKGEKAEAHFTEIRLSKIRPAFKKLFSNESVSSLGDKGIAGVMDYLTREKENKKVISLSSLGEYCEFIVQLANICPVQYLDDGPIKSIPPNRKEAEFIDELKYTLRNFNFQVVIQGIELRKPLRFPLQASNQRYGKDYIVQSFDRSAIVEGNNLSFKGYFFSQHGTIYPKEYSGIIIRLKNVAIGDADSTLLSYPLGKNMIFRHWVFGEIYVTDGLEEAMTIDRSSFKPSHPHFQYLQEYIHKYLDKTVFQHVLLEYYWHKRKIRDEEKSKKHLENLKNIIREGIQKSYSIEFSKKRSSLPVFIDNYNRKVFFNSGHPVFRSIKKSKKPEVEQFLLMLEIAVEKSKGNIEELRKILFALFHELQ